MSKYRIQRSAPDLGDVEYVTLSNTLSTITANTTTYLSLGAVPGFTAWIRKAVVSVGTVPADADGAITATLEKYDASADAAVTLSSSVNLETLTADEATDIAITATLTDAQLLLDQGDTLRLAVVNDSAAINTQPAQLIVRVLVALRRAY